MFPQNYFRYAREFRDANDSLPIQGLMDSQEAGDKPPQFPQAPQARSSEVDTKLYEAVRLRRHCEESRPLPMFEKVHPLRPMFELALSHKAKSQAASETFHRTR
jgi:hypothetical protein